MDVWLDNDQKLFSQIQQLSMQKPWHADLHIAHESKQENKIGAVVAALGHSTKEINFVSVCNTILKKYFERLCF